MKPWLKWTIGIASVLCGAAILAWAFIHFEIRKPRKLHAELCLRSPEDFSPGEIREAAHQCLKWVSDHDAFLTLEQFGDETSIPILIKSLARVRQPDENGGVMCTSTHCLSALQKLSGQDFGFDVGAWKEWWKEAGPSLRNRR